MSDSFDPYRKWLGIPLKDQPPDHYRLLGIEPFEDDLDVIVNGADGRTAQLQGFQSTEHADLSQRLLEEVAVARACLLSAEKKAAYDELLRVQQMTGTKSEAVVSITTRSRSSSVETAAPAAKKSSVPEIAISRTVSHPRSAKRKKKGWHLPLATIVVGALLIGLLIFLSGLGRGGAAWTAQQPGASALQQIDVGSAQPSTTPRQKNRPPADSSRNTRASGNETTGDRSQDGAGRRDRPAAAVPPRLLGELLDRDTPEERDAPEQMEPKPASEDHPDTPTADPTAPSVPSGGPKEPAPDRDTRQEAERRVHEVFREDFAQARTSQQKSTLAVKLLKQADATADPSARFALLQLAAELTADAGDLRGTVACVDRIANLYAIEPTTVKSYYVNRLSDTLRSTTPDRPILEQLCDDAMKFADLAVAKDNFELADPFVKLAHVTVRILKDVQRTRTLTVRSREIDRLRSRYAAVSKAMEILAESPDDPKENLTVGSWLCFTKEDWLHGLPLLAKGSDSRLAELAQKDLAQPTEPQPQAELGDRWWEAAERESSLASTSLRGRAGHWYRQALPKLASLDKVRIEKRLDEMKVVDDPVKTGVRGVIQNGNVALAGNGTKVAGVDKDGATLFDGDISYKKLAVGTCPCRWVITFDKPYMLREIRFRLYDGTKSAYRYMLESSADGEQFEVLTDRSKGEWFGWQQLPFTPRVIKSLRLTGVENLSDNPRFHVSEFEAYCIPPIVPPGM